MKISTGSWRPVLFTSGLFTASLIRLPTADYQKYQKFLLIHDHPKLPTITQNYPNYPKLSTRVTLADCKEL